MAGLEDTMRHARQTLAAEPVLRRAPPPSPAAPPDRQAAADEIDSDIAQRLERLDSDQLLDEWANDTAEDWADEDAEAALAAGREEAIGLIEEEIVLLDEPLTTDAP